MKQVPTPSNYRRQARKGDIVTVEFTDEKYREHYYNNSSINIKQKFTVIFTIGDRVRLRADDNRCILLDTTKIILNLSTEDNNIEEIMQAEPVEKPDDWNITISALGDNIVFTEYWTNADFEEMKTFIVVDPDSILRMRGEMNITQMLKNKRNHN